MTKIIIPLLAVALLAGCAKEFSSRVKFHSYDHADQYFAGNNGTFNDVDTVLIDWEVGKIEISQSTDGTASFSETSGELSADEQAHYWQEGRTLHLRFWASGRSGKVRSHQKELTLKVPEGVALVVENSTGEIDAERLSLSQASFTNITGSVELDSLTAETLQVKVTTGDVELDRIHTTSIDVESTTGKVEIDEVHTSTLRVVTTTGKVELSLRECDKCDVDVTTGRVEIELNGLGANVFYDTATGKYHADSHTFGDRHCDIHVTTTTGSLYVYPDAKP